MKRLSKIPVVQESVSSLNNFYEKAKEHNVERIHGIMDMASSIGWSLRCAVILLYPVQGCVLICLLFICSDRSCCQSCECTGTAYNGRRLDS